MTPVRTTFSVARLTIAAASLALLSLAACNTVDGMGEDISAGGKAVSGTAEKTQKKLP